MTSNDQNIRIKINLYLHKEKEISAQSGQGISKMIEIRVCSISTIWQSQHNLAKKPA
jgi:hypothetical protein